MLAPEARVLDDSTHDGVRRLRLQVTSSRQPWGTFVAATTEIGIQAVVVGGQRFNLDDKPIDESKNWSMTYLALPEQGVELEIELAPLKS